MGRRRRLGRWAEGLGLIRPAGTPRVKARALARELFSRQVLIPWAILLGLAILVGHFYDIAGWGLAVGANGVALTMAEDRSRRRSSGS